MRHNLWIVVIAALALSLFNLAAMAEDAPTGLPAAAKGFAGMIRGQVVSTGTNELTLKVAEVTKVWKHSKAENPQSLVGRQVQVRGRDGDQPTPVARFIATLKPGDTVTIDVNNREGDTLTLVELTADQREKVKQAK